MTETSESSDSTAVQTRIRAYRTSAAMPVRLRPFQASGHSAPEHLPFAFLDYLELMDWTGRAVLEHKRGAIPAHVPPVLARLGIDPEAYLKTMCRGGNRFGTAIGRPGGCIAGRRQAVATALPARDR